MSITHPTAKPDEEPEELHVHDNPYLRRAASAGQKMHDCRSGQAAANWSQVVRANLLLAETLAEVRKRAARVAEGERVGCDDPPRHEVGCQCPKKRYAEERAARRAEGKRVGCRVPDFHGDDCPCEDDASPAVPQTTEPVDLLGSPVPVDLSVFDRPGGTE